MWWIRRIYGAVSFGGYFAMGDICDNDHLHKYYMRTMALRGMSL